MDLTQVVTIILAAVAALGAVRSWMHSAEARAISEELIEDVTDRLREDIAVAVAEGADAVIAKLPKSRTKAQPAAPAAQSTEEPQQ